MAGMTTLDVTETIPASLQTVDASTDAGREWLAARYHRDGENYVRLNMITSLTGSAAGSDGTSETLTNRVDRAILGVIRADADVVLVGAQSVRAEGYVVPRRARLAVVTASGDLEGHRLSLGPGSSPDQVLLVCPEDGAEALRERALAYGVQVVGVSADDDGRLHPAAIIEALSARGLRRVVCEGGPSLATQFAAAGLIDEYCVSVAPVIGAVDKPFISVPDGVSTELVGALVDSAGFSYLRLRARS
jgi:riboflavin biosynthesis pyrimidine reductase